MDTIVVLDWTFSPPEYFEEPDTSRPDVFEFTIGHGKVEARIDAAAYERDPSLRESLHDAVKARFLAVQSLTHRGYELSRPRMMRLNPDGRRDIYLNAETGHFKLSVGTPDIRVTDKNGNVLTDTRRERIEKKKQIAELAETHRANKLLQALLCSYDAAVKDPDDELVHLYEIPEALCKRFGGEKNAQTALKINPPLKQLKHLACNEPVRQGRHRGNFPGPLRDATEEELAEARKICCRFD